MSGGSVAVPQLVTIVSVAGRRDDPMRPIDVPPGVAHKLAEAPVTYRRIVGQQQHGGGFVETFWELTTLGFIEAEAAEAHDRAVEEVEAVLASGQSVQSIPLPRSWTEAAS